MQARNLRITGHVQGVFFRADARERALSLGIAGWARNTADGSVEMYAEGGLEALQALEKWCERGSDAARVEKVDVQEVPVQGCTGFVVL